MDTWETIRLRCVRDREPVKTVARELGLSKNTVKKYIRSLQAIPVSFIPQSTTISLYWFTSP